MAFPTHGSLKARGQRDQSAKVQKFAGGGDVKEDKKLVKGAMGKHDKQLHPGKHTRLGYADGGAVEGGAAKARLDRPGRAPGGRAGGKKKAGNHVNIVIAGHHPPGAGGPPGGGMPLPGAAARPPVAPPPAPPPGPPGMGGPPPMGGAPMGPRPPMGPPPGAMGAPGAPPMMRAKGGRIAKASGGATPFLKHGSKGGLGRLEKAGHEKGRHAQEGENKPQTEHFEDVHASDGSLEDKPTHHKKGGRV